MRKQLFLVVSAALSFPAWSQLESLLGQDWGRSKDCYRGPPSSAKECNMKKFKEGTGLKKAEVKGKPYKRGIVGKEVECIEDQYLYVDHRGCLQYCRIKTTCGGT